MSQIVGDLFQCPPSRKRPRGKIITQIMKADSGNHCLLACCRLLFKRTKPVMQTGFGEPCISLRSEDIQAGFITRSLLKVGMEWTSCLIDQIDISGFGRWLI